MSKLLIPKHFVTLLLLVCGSVAIAQTPEQDSAYVRDNFTKMEVQIPVRDGVRLFTSIYLPKDQSKQHPILLNRTPYSCAPYGPDMFKTSFQNMNLARAGYIFVFQDVRGRYMSEGTYMDVRPFQPDKKGLAVDEASDTYDTVDWLLKNIKGHNNRVGVYGISYPGFYATMAILAAHPAIRAVSPQAPVTDWFIGDDFHHNGAFMLMDAFSFYSGFGKIRPNPTTEHASGFSDWKTPDNYHFYLQAGALSNFGERYGMKEIPFWTDLMTHPDYDAWWQARNPRPHLRNVLPAVLTVGGLFDAEDCFGAWRTYEALEKQNPPNHSNRIVMGPWIHGGWARGNGERLGNVTFGQRTSSYFMRMIELPFFEYYLKDIGSMTLPDASIFETGSNQWTQYDAWPPKNTEATRLNFQKNGRLGLSPTIGVGKPDEYVSDPAKPVPYTEDVHLSRTREYMTDDQRFAARRPDVLVYQTDVLDQTLTITGTITADLYVSTTGTDADFVVKVIDVFPDTLSGVENGVPLGGYQMLVRGEIMRGRYRDSFEKPSAFIPGKITHVKFDLPDIAHAFLPGHRLMVQVQSSWFPLADRNPQQFINIYTAKDVDFKKATHALYHQEGAASSIVLPVLRK